MRQWLIFTFVSIWLSAGSAVAQEAPRGRLPDGKAYRTDSQGVQMVDYLAELEVTIEELQRQVSGLQGEIREKDAQTERGQRDPSARGVQERTLVASPREPSRPVAPSIQRALELGAPIKDDCATATAQLRKELLVSQTELAKTQADSTKLQSDLVQLQAQNQSFQEQLKTEKTAFQTAQQDWDRQRVQGGRAPLRSHSDPSLNPQQQAVATARSSLNSDLNKLKRLIESRDHQFRQQQQGGQSISLRPTPAVSRRGLGPKDLTLRLERANTMRELALIKRDMLEIESKINEDLALVQRMKNVRS